MIELANGIRIGEHELEFKASRSGGPGGQNVNKVSSKVTLAFDVARSPSLSEPDRQRILDRLRTRITNDGILRVAAQEYRSQDMNRQAAIERFVDLLSRALHRPARRVATALPRAAAEARLREKHRRGRAKRLRSRYGEDES